ncbi:MAG TPA: FAD-dependent oxidoreductase [Flavisolibacter sp.]
MAENKKKVGVVGAGPAGLTAAYLLCKKGFAVDVYEADTEVGGMCKTIELWNNKVDIGPHRFFSNDRRVNELWLDVVGSDYEMVSRLTRIFYKGKYFDYPLKPVNAFVNLGPVETTRCLLSYAQQRFTNGVECDDFERWVTKRFGYRLYSIFFKTYSEKLWGIPCTELDVDFAAQRIKKLSLYEAVKNAFFGGGRHKTLVDEFAYPVGGTGMVYQKMADKIKEAGGRVMTSTPIKKICVEEGSVKGMQLSNGKELSYDSIISTMPLTHLVRTMDDVPSNVREKVEGLKFRNTIIVYLNIAGKNLFPDNWLYVHSSELRTGRITNFRNWVPQICKTDTTILALEFWSNNDEELWQLDDAQLIDLAKKDIQKTGLIGNCTILDGAVYRVPKCYPVYQKGYKQNMDVIQPWLNTIQNLQAIGRYGSFKYNNQDHSILMGILASENLAENKSHNLWDVNTDYESYQESTCITKTGLMKQ